MKKIFTLLLSSLILNAIAGKNIEGPFLLGSTQEVHKAIHLNINEIQVQPTLKYNTVVSHASNTTVSGTLQGFPESSYFISMINNQLTGFIIVSKKDDIAYKYSTNDFNQVSLTRTSVQSILCIDYASSQISASSSKTTASSLIVPANGPVPSYSSLPYSTNVLYLDFDGYDLPAGTGWNSGNAISTAASGYTDSEIYQAWSIVAEDYFPFDLNVTTDEATFLSADTMTRVRMVFTPTSSFHPNAGGVAYVGVFNYFDQAYKTGWVFVNNLGGSAQNAGEACAHEAGHTLGLQHHGTVLGVDSTEYYSGHGSWAPIMGAAYNKDISQFCKGEYTNAFCYEYDNANNKVAIQQDDIAVITQMINYKADDHGNTTNAATEIVYTLNGNIGTVDSASNNGIIGKQSDLDVFHFYTGGGGINLNFYPSANVKTNLDVQVKLYDNNNSLVNTFSTAHNSNCIYGVNINQNLPAGYYFVVIDGVGSGDPTTGWSDYNSVGPYSIQGTINNPDINTNAVATALYQGISIYPNPLNGSDYLNFSGTMQQTKVYDMAGKLLLTENNSNRIDISTLAQGLYTVQLTNNSENTSIKIIK